MFWLSLAALQIVPTWWILDAVVCLGRCFRLFCPAWNAIILILEVGFICPFMLAYLTLGTKIVGPGHGCPARLLDLLQPILNSELQITSLFTNYYIASECVNAGLRYPGHPDGINPAALDSMFMLYNTSCFHLHYVNAEKCCPGLSFGNKPAQLQDFHLSRQSQDTMIRIWVGKAVVCQGKPLLFVFPKDQQRSGEEHVLSLRALPGVQQGWAIELTRDMICSTIGCKCFKTQPAASICQPLLLTHCFCVEPRAGYAILSLLQHKTHLPH